MYDRLLRLPILERLEIIAYADEFTVMAKALFMFKVGDLLEEAAEAIVDWLDGIGIELALN